ncbi:MAG: hypothetical protein ACTSW2_08780 [Alphaproteobacteria bacterium]
MEHLDRPDEALWDERRLWFEGRETAYARAGAPAPSEQACALMIDLQAVFCAGAWSAAVILAAAIVDCQARASNTHDSDVPRGLDAKTWRWLRALRNRLVHEDRTDPALTIDDQWQRRSEWEGHARRAVEAAFVALYPGASE